MTNDSCFLSIIVPAYNEEKRISTTLSCLHNFSSLQSYLCEIIVVDDGSTDKTLDLLYKAQLWFEGLIVIKNQHQGKAVAINTGVSVASGDIIFFTDADLSTPMEELSKLLLTIERGADIAIGSREGQGAKRINEPLLRHVMGRVFNYLVLLLINLPFRDTQCGFKAFRHNAAKHIFTKCQLYTNNSPKISRSAVTAFDVEVLFLALYYGYETIEVPVVWYYKEGSKVNPVIDSISLLKDVLKVRWNALRGKYGKFSNKAIRFEASKNEDYLDVQVKD